VQEEIIVRYLAIPGPGRSGFRLWMDCGLTELFGNKTKIKTGNCQIEKWKNYHQSQELQKYQLRCQYRQILWHCFMVIDSPFFAILVSFVNLIGQSNCLHYSGGGSSAVACK
jgi:hypothetical protein